MQNNEPGVDEPASAAGTPVSPKYHQSLL